MESTVLNNVVVISSDSEKDGHSNQHIPDSYRMEMDAETYSSDDDVYFIPRRSGLKMINDCEDLPRIRRERRHSKMHLRSSYNSKSTKSPVEEDKKCQSFTFDDDPPRIPPLPDLSEVIPSLFSNNINNNIQHNVKPYHKENTHKHDKIVDNRNPKKPASTKKKRKSVDWYKSQSNAILGELFSVSSPHAIAPQAVHNGKHTDGQKYDRKTAIRQEHIHPERKRNKSDSSVVKKSHKLFPQYSLEDKVSADCHNGRRHISSSTDKKHDSKKRYIDNSHYNNGHHQKKVKRELKLPNYPKHSDKRNDNHKNIERSHSHESVKHKFKSKDAYCVKRKIELRKSLSTGDQTVKEKAGAFEILESLNQSEKNSFRKTSDSIQVFPKSEKVPLKNCVTLLSDVMKLPGLNECKEKINSLFINLSVLKNELDKHEDQERQLKYKAEVTDRHFLDVITVSSDNDDHVDKPCDTDSLTVDLLSVSESTDEEPSIKRSVTPIIITDSDSLSSACRPDETDSIDDLKPGKDTQEVIKDTDQLEHFIDKPIIKEVTESEGSNTGHELSSNLVDTLTEKVPPTLSRIDELTNGNIKPINQMPPKLILEEEMSEVATEHLMISDNETVNQSIRNYKSEDDVKANEAFENLVTDQEWHCNDSETIPYVERMESPGITEPAAMTLDNYFASSPINSDDEESSKNIGMDFSFKSGDFSDVSCDEDDNDDDTVIDFDNTEEGNKDLSIKSDKMLGECKKVLSAYALHRHLDSSCVHPSKYSDVSDIDDNLPDISYKTDLYSDVSDAEEKVKDFYFKSDKYSDVSGDEKDTQVVPSGDEKDTQVVPSEQLYTVDGESDVEAGPNDDKSQLEAHDKPSHCQDQHVNDIPNGLTQFKKRRNIFDIMSDAENSTCLSDINDSDIEFQSCDKDENCNINDKEIHTLEYNSKTVCAKLDIDENTVEGGICESPLCASTCDNIFSKLSNITSTPSLEDTPVSSRHSISISSSIEKTSFSSTNTSLSSSDHSLSTTTSVSSDHSLSSDSFITPHKPFRYLGRRSCKRKVRCSTQTVSAAINRILSPDLLQVQIKGEVCTSYVGVNDRVSQLSRYIQDYLPVDDHNKGVQHLPGVCKTMIQCCQEDENLFNLDHALRFVYHFSKRYIIPSEMIQLVLKHTFLQDNVRHMNVCLDIVKNIDSLCPGQIHVTWENLNSCLSQLISKTDEIDEDERNSQIRQLTLFTRILRNSLFSKDLTDSREIRNTDAFKLLTFDSIKSKRKDLLLYVQQESTQQKDGYNKANRSIETCDKISVDILEQLQDLLSLCVDCSSSCVDCANSMAGDLTPVYLQQPRLADKHRIVHTISSPLLRYKLVQQILENQYRDTIPCCSFPDSLESVIQGFFRATPIVSLLTPPISPVEERLKDVDQTSLYVPDDTEELAMLLYYAVESYLTVYQGRLYMALRRRCHYAWDYQTLLDADREELARLPDHVTALEKHLRQLTPDLTPAAEHYLMLLNCLADLVETDH